MAQGSTALPGAESRTPIAESHALVFVTGSNRWGVELEL